jgi:hypothetical protein
MKWDEYAAPRFAALRPHGRATAEDVRVAAHESGHALARWSTGSAIAGVTIDPSDAFDGKQINGRCWGDGTFDPENDRDYFNRIVELCAGSVAELVYQGETLGLRGSDRRKAYAMAQFLCDGPIAADLLIRAAQAEAEHLLRRYEHVLDVLATRLLDCRTMTGVETVSLIEREAAKLASRNEFSRPVGSSSSQL